MGKFKDIVGAMFTRLTVVNLVGRNKYGQMIWSCECECGNYKNVTTGDLNNNRVKSCGCLNIQKRIETHSTHGLSKRNKLYRVWDAMKQRCYNSKCKAYHNYGARGICISDVWINYENFHLWAISNGYKNGLTIERINNDGNYSPNNCRWTAMKENIRNRRITLNIEHKGEMKPLAEWCEIYGLKYNITQQRLRRGWSIEQAFLNLIHKAI